MRVVRSVLAGAVLLVVLGACFMGGASVHYPTAYAGNTQMRFVNTSPVPVCYVYISPSQAGDWGDDWLGSNETVASGGFRDFYVAPSNYDVRVTDCNGAVRLEQYALLVNQPGQVVVP